MDAPEPAAASPTVRSHLLQQLPLLDLEKRDEDICRYLIGCVDGHGFLNEDWAAAAERLGVPAGRVEDCVRLLRGLSPPGICSAGIRECLIAQLDEDEDEDEGMPDYPVTVFYTREGYFKKITPQSLRMSGEQKLKEGDEITVQMETKNNAELLFFTSKCQVYKCRVGDFDDGKASVMGDYIAARLGMEEGETPVYMALTTDYKGHMFFLFANGKAAKVPMESYATKQNRRKLLNAFSDKSPLVYAAHLHEECELAIYTSAGRMLLVNSAQVPAKQTKNTAGERCYAEKEPVHHPCAPRSQSGIDGPAPLPRAYAARGRCYPARRGHRRADAAAVRARKTESKKPPRLPLKRGAAAAFLIRRNGGGIKVMRPWSPACRKAASRHSAPAPRAARNRRRTGRSAPLP